MHPPLLLPDPLTPRAMGLPIVAGREGTVITETVYSIHHAHAVDTFWDGCLTQEEIVQGDKDRPLKLVAGWGPTPELLDTKPLRDPRGVLVDTPCLCPLCGLCTVHTQSPGSCETMA